MSSLYPLYSWINNGIMTLVLCMDIGLMLFLFTVLWHFQFFLLWLHNLHCFLVLLCFHLNELSASLPGFIMPRIRTSTMLFLRPYQSFSTSHSTEVVNREKSCNYAIPCHDVMFAWRITLCPFTLGFIPIRVWLIQSMLTSAGVT